MTEDSKAPFSWPIFLLRIALGWLFLYAGLTKIMNPEWTAAGFLNNAENFQGVFSWFGSASNIGWVDFLNQWGQFLIGLGLITGTLTRLSSFFGIILMALYYLPDLNFPYIGEHGYIVDEHLIYALSLLVLVQLNAGQYFGFDKLLSKKFKGWWL